MANRFTDTQWNSIEQTLLEAPEKFGMPEGGREESVVFASFNIRKLGKAKGRERELNFMARFCARCDLVAIQEVQDELSGLRYLKDRVDERVSSAGEFGLIVSDITGRVPGESGMAERLAFLYRRSRVNRTEMASDLTVDRTGVIEHFDENQETIIAAWRKFHEGMKRFEDGDRKGKPTFRLPAFITFTRTPHVTAFEVPGADGKVLAFIAVNAHLIYGSQKERDAEFRALVEWMTNRLVREERMVAPNFVLLGDLNLNFDQPRKDHARIAKFIRNLNAEVFKSAEARRIYFPFIDPHPATGRPLRSTARQTQTFDQIAFLRGKREAWLPNDRWRASVGSGPDAFDYGVFNFTDLFATALKGGKYLGLSKADRDDLNPHFQHSVSDHMPIWVRIPRPGFAPPPDV
ncbi:MAG: endonuclease/exonuclease/phosphatase [Proteobacteria bacterium]|nr:endonuclease/exonuclease/phosphatase [Pseudomonadota bacterium]